MQSGNPLACGGGPCTVILKFEADPYHRSARETAENAANELGIF
jgi:hypothetical protein